MPTVTSKDGTKIAFDKVGSGPAAKRWKVRPTWLTPKCSPRSSSNSFNNNTGQGVGWTTSLVFSHPQVISKHAHDVLILSYEEFLII